MEELLRKSGIDVIGNIPWGSRLCLLYRTPEELTDILMPFLRSGLENNEYCLWIISRPLDEESTVKSLQGSIPGYDKYAAAGQIDIIPYTEWYFKNGSLNLPGTARNWDAKLNRTAAKGFMGLRAAFNLNWLEKKDWQSFMKFEAAVEDDIHKKLSIYAYSLENLEVPEIIDVVNSHQLALFRRNGKWDILDKHESNVHLTLEKRIKELRCLYDIARIAGMPDITLKGRLEEIAKILPLVLQYPGNTFSRISVNGEEYKTGDYRDSAPKITADISVSGAKAGSVEIGYVECPPSAEKDLFSKEEVLLLDAVAERLGRLIEHRQAEDALKESEEKFSKAFHASPAIITITRLEDGQFIEVNDSHAHITGYTHEEALKLNSITAGVWRNAEERNYALRDLKTKGKVRNLEVTMRTKTGEIRDGLFSADLINIGGKPCVLSVILDITERKYLERRVVEYEDLNKLKGDLLATVSHELRTPLATIKGYSTMILDYFKQLSVEETRDYIKSIDISADKLTKLVDNLLDTSRIDAGLLKLEKTPVSIASLIKEVVREANVRPINHRIVIALGKPLPRVNIDIKRIHQVLDNLIDNAVKYSPAGTEITISAWENGRDLHIGVTDQGPGIPPGELTNIFERMYRIEQRLSSSSSGIGLGLHVCQQLVEAHGGHIWAESTIGKGSTIQFTLPLTITQKIKNHRVPAKYAGKISVRR